MSRLSGHKSAAWWTETCPESGVVGRCELQIFGYPYEGFYGRRELVRFRTLLSLAEWKGFELFSGGLWLRNPIFQSCI